MAHRRQWWRAFAGRATRSMDFVCSDRTKRSRCSRFWEDGSSSPAPYNWLPICYWPWMAEHVTTERLVRIVAGSFMLFSLGLAWRVDGVRLFDGPTWLWLAAFVTANLLQSGFTRCCLLEGVVR
jgi:hypothetical protein